MIRHPSQQTALIDHTHAVAQPNSVGPGALSAEAYGTTTVAIDPDDAAGAGTSAKVSREDHGHEWLTATASALTKTATSTEGSSGDGARADHGHSTAALPWGIVGYQRLTGDSSVFSANATTDFTRSVTVDATRLYEVHLDTQYSISTTGEWVVNFHVDGTLTDRFDFVDFAGTGDGVDRLTNSLLWLPTSGTKTADVRVVEFSGTSTLTFQAAADNSRRYWIKDVGPR